MREREDRDDELRRCERVRARERGRGMRGARDERSESKKDRIEE